MAWSFENGIPIYQQIITKLKMQIAAGIYQPDDRLPPVRELAMDAGVNPNTMQRALAQMEQEGVLYTNRTAGRHVASDPEKIRSLRKQIAEDEIARMFGKLVEGGNHGGGRCLESGSLICRCLRADGRTCHKAQRAGGS